MAFACAYTEATSSSGGFGEFGEKKNRPDVKR